MSSQFPTELYYAERTVFRKRSLNNGTWSFEIGTASGNKHTTLGCCRISGK